MDVIVCKNSTDFLVKMADTYKEKYEKGLNPKIKLHSKWTRDDSKMITTAVLIVCDDNSVVRISYDATSALFETLKAEDMETFCKGEM